MLKRYLEKVFRVLFSFTFIAHKHFCGMCSCSAATQRGYWLNNNFLCHCFHGARPSRGSCCLLWASSTCEDGSKAAERGEAPGLRSGCVTAVQCVWNPCVLSPCVLQNHFRPATRPWSLESCAPPCSCWSWSPWWPASSWGWCTTVMTTKGQYITATRQRLPRPQPGNETSRLWIGCSRGNG